MCVYWKVIAASAILEGQCALCCAAYVLGVVHVLFLRGNFFKVVKIIYVLVGLAFGGNNGVCSFY
jgi:hypothetical protein